MAYFERFTNIPPSEWLMTYCTFVVMGFGLLFISNFWRVHENLERYRTIHRRAAMIATVLCILFWPLAPYVVRKVGEWIIRNTEDPLAHWRQ